jgi:hypothetical protein
MGKADYTVKLFFAKLKIQFSSNNQFFKLILRTVSNKIHSHSFVIYMDEIELALDMFLPSAYSATFCSYTLYCI